MLAGAAVAGRRVLVTGNPLITLQSELPVIENGAVIVTGNLIEAVGTAEDLRTRGPFDDELGGRDAMVMPGLWNSHFHSEAAFWPGVFDHIYERTSIWVHEAVSAVPEEDIYWNTLGLIVRAIKSGTTGFLDFFYGRLGMDHFGVEPAARAFMDSGARAAIGLASRDQSKYVHGDDQAFLASLPDALRSQVEGTIIGYAYPWEETASAFRVMAGRYMDAAGGRFRMMLAPDWTPATSDTLYMANKVLAGEFGATLQTHLLETKYEMLYNVKNHGKTGARRLADIGFLGPDVGAAHFVWASDDDISAVIDSGATVIHNPGSNLRLTSGLSPVRVMLERGARVAFGTDSISVNDDDDMFEELRIAGYQQRSNAMYGIDSGRISSFDLLHGASHNGAALGGFGDDIGVLIAGNRADLLLLDRDRIFSAGKFDFSEPLDVIMDRAQGSDVRTSMVDGRIIMRDRRILSVDEEQVKRKCAEAASHMFLDPPQWLLDLRPAVVDLEPHVLEFFRRWDRVPITSRYLVNTLIGPEAGPIP